MSVILLINNNFRVGINNQIGDQSTKKKTIKDFIKLLTPVGFWLIINWFTQINVTVNVMVAAKNLCLLYRKQLSEGLWNNSN